MRIISFIFFAIVYSQSSFAACGATPDGTIEYNTGSSVYQLCNGSTWQTIKLDATNDGACSTANSIEYDATDKYHKVCVGGNYKPVACVGGTGTCTTYTSCAGTTNGTVNFVTGQGFRWCDGSFWRQMNIEASGPDTTATKVIISGPTSIEMGVCNLYTVTALNTSNEPVALGSSNTVTLTDDTATGTFHSDAGCTSGVIPSISIASGSASGIFYYKNTAGEASKVITATPTGLTLDTLTYTSIDVTNGVNCLSATVSTVSSTAPMGTLLDQAGTGSYVKNTTCQYRWAPAVGGTMTFTMTSFGSEASADYLNIYDNTTNSGTRATGVTAPGLSGSVTLPYLMTTSSGNAFLDFTQDNDNNVGTGFSITWRAYGGTKLAFQSGSTTSIAEAACQSYIIERQTSGSVATTSPFSATVNLTSGSSGGSYYSNNTCTSSITSAVISADATSVRVYYKDEKPGSWTLTATDAGGVFTNGTLAITTTEAVNDAPLAANDALITPKDTVLDMTIATALFGNDSDEEGDAISLNSIATISAQGGTIALQGAGVYRYTPPTGYIGPDSFTYTAKDPSNAVSNTATVSISVGTVMAPATFVQRTKIKVNGTYSPTMNETIGSSGDTVSASGRMVAVGAPGYSGSAGAVYLFRDPNNDGDWTGYSTDIRLQAPTPTANYVYGHSVSLSGQFLIVGEPAQFAGVGNGRAFIYKDDDGTDWTNVSTTPVATISPNNAPWNRPTSANEGCGLSVAIYGRVAVIGCPLNDDDDSTPSTLGTGKDNSGAVLIVRDTSAGNDWSSIAYDKYLKAPAIVAAERFGGRIVFDGTTLVIASDASGSANTAEKVWVYRDPDGDGDWSNVALAGILVETGGAATTDDNFGESISLRNNVIVVGAPLDDAGTLNCGAVHVFRDHDNDGDWSEAVLDKTFFEDSATRATTNAYGNMVRIKGDTIYVGAYSSNSQAGRVWTYRDPDTNGAYDDAASTPLGANVKKIELAGAGEQFGRSLAIDDTLGFTTLFGAAPSEDTTQTNSGALYIYQP